MEVPHEFAHRNDLRAALVSQDHIVPLADGTLQTVCTSEVQTAAASGRQTASIGPQTGFGFSTHPTFPISSIAKPFIYRSLPSIQVRIAFAENPILCKTAGPYPAVFSSKTTSQPSKAVAMLDKERPLLAKRWPEMAAKIQKRLLAEGKITKEMIESYVDAYAGIYGDDTDAYVEEIVADTYAGMNRTDYGHEPAARGREDGGRPVAEKNPAARERRR